MARRRDTISSRSFKGTWRYVTRWSRHLAIAWPRTSVNNPAQDSAAKLASPRNASESSISTGHLPHTLGQHRVHSLRTPLKFHAPLLSRPRTRIKLTMFSLSLSLILRVSLGLIFFAGLESDTRRVALPFASRQPPFYTSSAEARALSATLDRGQTFLKKNDARLAETNRIDRVRIHSPVLSNRISINSTGMAL